MDTTLICQEEVATVLGLFNLGTAPILLYYAYVPISLLVLATTTFVWAKARNTSARLLLALGLAFVGWILINLVQWVAVHHDVLMFGWQLNIIFEVALATLALHLFLVFVLKHDVGLVQKIVLYTPLALGALVVPTTYNIAEYVLEDCEGVQGIAWNFVYAFQFIVAATILIVGITRAFRDRVGDARINTIVLSLATTFLVAIFSGASFIGDYYGVYELELLGPVGMLLFIMGIAYSIARFNAFNIRALGTQILVFGLWFAMFATLFVVSVDYIHAVIAFTLIFFTIAGYSLIKSIDREHQQLNQIQKLAADLQQVNNQQVNLLNFVTHQVKGFFTKTRNIFAMSLEGEFGEPPELLKRALREGQLSDEKGVSMVQELLNATHIRRGTVEYDFKRIDVAAILSEVEKELMSSAGAKGVELSVAIEPGDHTVMGDALHLHQAIRNVVDNAIRYTPKGRIDVTLKNESGSVVLASKDTGIGLSQEDMGRLFTEGGRGKESRKFNVDSTGYGLYIVKNVIEAHKGTVTAHSDGPGTGSTFTITLPLAPAA